MKRCVSVALELIRQVQDVREVQRILEESGCARTILWYLQKRGLVKVVKRKQTWRLMNRPIYSPVEVLRYFGPEYLALIRCVQHGAKTVGEIAKCVGRDRAWTARKLRRLEGLVLERFEEGGVVVAVPAVPS
ncbi:MAG: hypothetical protein ACP5I3_11550 [Thermoproteus sp.]